MNAPAIPVWSEPLLALAASLLAGFATRPLLVPLLARVARGTDAAWDDLLLRVVRGPLAPATAILAFHAASVLSPATRAAFPSAPAVLGTAWTILAAWTILRALGVAESVVAERVASAGPDNIRQRSLATQVRVARRIVAAAVVFLAFALCLLHFEEVRRLGTGLLASAGIAGVVLGFSAQKAIGNLLAGVQIAFSQPVRLDDVVVVEGEWGRVEEITLTYVVVRIWDRRALVLPISHLLEKPFQNWTRTSASILGTVLLEVDHATDVEAVRAELARVVRDDPNWDGDVCSLQVVDAGTRTIRIRALVSSADSGRGWDLRCAVREKLLAFLARERPGDLPRVRVDRIPEPRASRAEAPDAA